MMNPVCVKCNCVMHCERVGVSVRESFHENPAKRDGEIYKLWHADLFQCQGCGVEMLAGFPMFPIAVHHEEGFAEKVVKAERVDNDGRIFWF